MSTHPYPACREHRSLIFDQFMLSYYSRIRVKWFVSRLIYQEEDGDETCVSASLPR